MTANQLMTATFDLGNSSGDSDFTRARLGALWRQRLDSGARIELNGGAGLWRANSASERPRSRKLCPAA